MGMDVVGRKPANERGEYFRNNVWWWRPLWDYCVTVAPDLCADVNGHFNDGDGLNEDGATQLADILLREIELGLTKAHETEYRDYIANLPRKSCAWCNGTGIRTDEVGVDLGFPTRELDEATAAVVGRTHGFCNGCHGEGTTESFEADYPFSVENVKEFALFLRSSGGFQIW